MIFRYARHTTDLYKMEKFYTEIIGLEKLGGFENHSNYNGLFLGHKNLNWHLEFTVSADKPNSKFDEEDALVFYVNTNLELTKIKERISKNNLSFVIPKNPYWLKSGIMITDPDGCRIIFSVKQLYFNSADDLTNLVNEKDIATWNGLIEYTNNLPYGRNSNREDFSLVLKENKGTCSSKHAFLKKIADLNGFNNVQLILGMYKMNHLNTPKISNTILNKGLEYIPEAHCYLRLNNQRIDITSTNSDIDNLVNDIIEEIEIEPEQVGNFKVAYHKNFLKNWILQENIQMSFDEVWTIREICIKKLEEKYIKRKCTSLLL